MKSIFTSKEKAFLIAEAALNKKGDNIIIMDMRAVSNVTDYFVVASAPSTRRVEAISRNITDALRLKGIRSGHSEGDEEALWVLLDYGDVMAHIFYNKTREFYDLERLWRDAPKEHYTQCIDEKSRQI